MLWPALCVDVAAGPVAGRGVLVRVAGCRVGRGVAGGVGLAAGVGVRAVTSTSLASSKAAEKPPAGRSIIRKRAERAPGGAFRGPVVSAVHWALEETLLSTWLSVLPLPSIEAYHEMRRKYSPSPLSRRAMTVASYQEPAVTATAWNSHLVESVLESRVADDAPL
jgi:hypothetical protein